jgi:hypothetical protein
LENPLHSKPTFDPTALLGQTADERRATALRMEEERQEARRSALAQQVSIHNTARERIDIWERLHALRLPSQPSHPLLKVIAKQTSLSVQEIVQEQQRRNQAAMAASNPSSAAL